MRAIIRLTIVAAALLGACSRSEAPSVPDDLKQDLAKVGGGDVQLAGSTTPRLDVVSAAERTDRAVVAPSAPTRVRVASMHRGTRAAIPSARRAVPAPVPSVATEQAPPAEAPRAEPAPEPVQSQQRPRQAPMPSTQREPAGGWKTPGQIIRNAPFPINP